MIGPLSLLLLSVGGGVGAVLRITTDTGLRRILSKHSEWATPIINIFGSFLMGFFGGTATFGLLGPTLTLFLTVGVLGGYTTFSTASVEVDALLRARKYFTAIAVAAGTFLLSTAAAATGLSLAWLAWS